VAVPDGLVGVRSPLPGTFYRSPRPGTPPFVGDGDSVESDTVVGLVETMKLFTSVAAGAAGTLVEFCVPDATSVEQDAVVALVKP
jgi:acetyl-CoA carboxylase biotin carboxyl carrier protein